MNEDTDIDALKAENEKLRIEHDDMKARIMEAEANLAAARHARDQFQASFEQQQKAHEEAIKSIERLKSGLRNPVPITP